MDGLGPRLTIERVRIGNSRPKVARACALLDRWESSTTFPFPSSDPRCAGAHAREQCGSRRYQTISIPEQWACVRVSSLSDGVESCVIALIRAWPYCGGRRCGASIPLRYCSLFLSAPTPRLFLTKISLATPAAHPSAIGAPDRNGNGTASGLLRCASVPESGSRIRTPNNIFALRCPKAAAEFGHRTRPPVLRVPRCTADVL